ncbi:MAG TPA: hypothetical protein VMR76_01860 [Candidatus Saccharimonadia bacterium]|nr:hypothetical protein [Candidatus Saccharimonadia bacterium]
MKAKETIYIDIEDEITAIIHKVTLSKAKLVVLVLPKRATVFQSLVNMKLLKNRTEKASKKLVLVTSDLNLYPIAGAVGLMVAKNLQDKPFLPLAPNKQSSTTVKSSEDPKTDGEKDIDKSKAVGELAAMSAVGGAGYVDLSSNEESIEFDNDSKTDKEKSSKSDETKQSKDGKKEKIDKRLKVPDFNRFQKMLLIGIAAIVVLIGLYIYGFVYLPTAKIIIHTQTSTLSDSIPLKLDSTQTTVDTTNSVVPANLQTVQKTITSSSVATTGTKQVGIEASGSITVTNAADYTSSYSIPAGTVFVDSSGNYSYTTDNSAVVPQFTCNLMSCVYNPSSPPIQVTATQVGSSYNIPAGTFSSTSLPSGYTASGGPMTGGDSHTVSVIAQTDVDKATAQIVAPDKTTIEQQLMSQIKAAGYQPLDQTFVEATPVIAPGDPVGTQTNSVTVSGVYNYTMYGAHIADLNTLVNGYVIKLGTFNSSNQSILDTGVSKASYTIQGSTPTTIQLTMQVNTIVGPKFNISSLKSQSAGKSNSSIINNISSITGVKTVTIKYSPFWVTAMPHSTKKITIDIVKADGSNL